MAVDITLDDIDLDYSGLTATSSPIREQDVRRIVVERYFEEDERNSNFADGFAEVVALLVPEQYWSEDNIRQLNLLPFWQQLLSYNDAVNIDTGRKAGSYSNETKKVLFQSSDIEMLWRAVYEPESGL